MDGKMETSTVYQQGAAGKDGVLPPSKWETPSRVLDIHNNIEAGGRSGGRSRSPNQGIGLGNIDSAQSAGV